jgi:hypothetical protein
MSQDLIDIRADAIAIPVLYLNTGLYPKDVETAKKHAERIAKEVAWKQHAKTTFIVVRWKGFQTYIDREIAEKFGFNPKIKSRHDVVKATKNVIILSRAYYNANTWIIMVIRFMNGIAVVLTG